MIKMKFYVQMMIAIVMLSGPNGLCQESASDHELFGHQESTSEPSLPAADSASARLLKLLKEFDDSAISGPDRQMQLQEVRKIIAKLRGVVGEKVVAEPPKTESLNPGPLELPDPARTESLGKAEVSVVTASSPTTASASHAKSVGTTEQPVIGPTTGCLPELSPSDKPASMGSDLEQRVALLEREFKSFAERINEKVNWLYRSQKNLVQTHP